MTTGLMPNDALRMRAAVQTWCGQNLCGTPQHWLRILSILLPLLATLLSSEPARADSDGAEIWLQVDTDAQILKVMQGQQVLRTFEDIAIGRSGPTHDKRRLDGKTPLGEFHISRINNDSHFHRFFGFDYPRLDHAERALKKGYLDADDYQAIRQAVRAGRVPPQNTPLGGNLGIHGIGAGDLEVHRDFNWTNGCIALTNREVDELAQWIQLGVRVVVY